MKYSILISVYNKEQYLSTCLDSVLNQNYDSPYQVIVCNDGSSDNSEKIIKKYQEKYDFIYIKQKNQGISVTRNNLIKKVTTPYFLFVDGDDYVKKDLLKKIDEELEKYENVDILSFNAIEIDENYNYIKTLKKPIIFTEKGDHVLTNFYKRKTLFTVPWGYVYRTSYFKDNDFQYPKGEILEDYYLTPLIILGVNKFVSVDYIGYYYVQSINSIIRKNTYENNKKIMYTYLSHYDKFVNYLSNSNISNDFKINFLKNISTTIIWWSRFLNYKDKKNLYPMLKERNIFNNVTKNPIFRIINKIKYHQTVIYRLKDQLKSNKIVRNIYNRLKYNKER